MPSKTQLAVMGAALLAYIVVSAIQQHVMPIPVIGRYLPGARMAA
jgi:hypothetical protein